MVMVGAEVYPLPPLVIEMESTVSPDKVTSAVAPVPPPPVMETEGVIEKLVLAKLYPEPPLVSVRSAVCSALLPPVPAVAVAVAGLL